jgi:hypothetical protein
LGSTLGKRIGCILVFASLVCPASSPARTPGADAPLGVVLQANLAHVKESALTEGATVYPGEDLSTDDGGSLDLRIVNSRFGLAANSRVHFYSGAKGSVAELDSGTLTFRRDTGADGFEVVASDVRIVPKGEGPVAGQVTFLSACKITVSSITGEIAITSGKESRIVKEGEAYSVLPEVGVLAVQAYISPDDPGYHKSHSHQTCALRGSPRTPVQFQKIGLAAGLAGAGVLIGIKLLSSHPSVESPDHP